METGQKGAWKDARATHFVPNPKKPFPGTRRRTPLVPGTNGCVQGGASDVGRGPGLFLEGGPRVPPWALLTAFPNSPGHVCGAPPTNHTTHFLGLEDGRLETQTCLD